MTTMWIDPKKPFDIKFFSGSHGQTWHLKGERKAKQPPAPRKVPVTLLDEVEV